MSNSDRNQVIYFERVTPKWSSFLPILLIYPTCWLTLAPINTLAGTISGLVGTSLTGLWMFLNSPSIQLTAEILRVGKAQIAIDLLGDAVIAPPGDRLATRIPGLDARAFLSLQGSKTGLIKLEIKDPNDPTPYWVFSTNNPAGLVDALNQAKSSI